MRVYRRYRGVGIYRIKTMILGSDYSFRGDGTEVATKPQYEISYKYAGYCYPYDTLEEIKTDIDQMIETAKNDNPELVEIMIDILNNE